MYRPRLRSQKSSGGEELSFGADGRFDLLKAHSVVMGEVADGFSRREPREEILRADGRMCDDRSAERTAGIHNDQTCSGAIGPGPPSLRDRISRPFHFPQVPKNRFREYALALGARIHDLDLLRGEALLELPKEIGAVREHPPTGERMVGPELLAHVSEGAARALHGNPRSSEASESERLHEVHE